MSAAKLTELESRVLAALASGREEFGYFNFKAIAKRGGIEVRHVRGTVRRLARFGFAQFGRGLWTDDGELYGSGYAITSDGRTAVAAANIQIPEDCQE